MEAISGLCWEGSRLTWDHLGLILGHPVAIFEAMLHRKACELENVEFTQVLYAFQRPGSYFGAMFRGLEGDLGPPGAWDILRPSWSYLRKAGGLLGSKATLLKCPNRFRSAPVQRKCLHATRKCIHKTHGKWKVLILHKFYMLF